MASRVHVHLTVSDLEASRAFYEKFLGKAPVKVKPGYLKFLPDVAPLNLAMFERANGLSLGRPPHLGIQMETPEEVQQELLRVKAEGLPVREEMAVNCCHANQDKFWVRDPDGVEWEVYNVNYDLEDEEGLPSSRRVTGKPVAIPIAQGAPAGCCGA